MPKDLAVDPAEIRHPNELVFNEIPIHAYATPFEEERRRYGDEKLKWVLRSMLVIREFETMLGDFKSTGAYSGIPYAYKGPAHLSIGQEGAAVGAALSLSPGDHIFGGHRSHGEFIAKGLSAVDKIDNQSLLEVMESHCEGRLLRLVENNLGAADERQLAERFLLSGLLAEIFMRADGFNGGMGGSMHAFFPPFGIYPNNAIVGGSAGIAAGSALFKKLNHKKEIAVANIGDGSTGCGPVWEALNFAAMGQFERLWQPPYRGALPVLFCFMNNFYAMGGQTVGETTGRDRLSRIAAGVNPENMHAETVDGANPLAVADAVRRKRALLVDGKGPALLDIECYRISGHSTTDGNVYRTREEIRAWTAHEPVTLFSASLRQSGLVSDAELVDMKASVKAEIRQITAAVVDPQIARIVDVRFDPTLIGKLMYSNGAIDLPTEPDPSIMDRDASPHLRQLARKSRSGTSPNGEKLSAMKAVTIRDALLETVVYHFERDPTLIAYGEECREWGGAFGVYRGLSDVLAYQRLFNSPISEALIVAAAVGYAMEGGRALVELMYGDFIGRAGDEIFNQMAKWQAMSAGALKLPIVLRCSVGSKYGAQHSQDWTGLVAHVPGLKLVYPATPYDAKGLLASALSSDDPVVFFESQRLYDTTEQFHAVGVPVEYYRIPLGEPDIKRTGQDVTILTIGPSLYPAIAAADRLEQSFDISAEVIDARSLVPFNYAPVLKSVSKTGHILLVSEASERGSFPMTLAANIARFSFKDLKEPPRVLGAPNWIVPGADMESTYFPQIDDIIDACGQLMKMDQLGRTGIRNWDELSLARADL
jgi:2-oxoisovalerate dehydrogenase E1 component